MVANVVGALILVCLIIVAAIGTLIGLTVGFCLGVVLKVCLWILNHLEISVFALASLAMVLYYHPEWLRVPSAHRTAQWLNSLDKVEMASLQVAILLIILPLVWSENAYCRRHGSTARQQNAYYQFVTFLGLVWISACTLIWA